MAKGRRRQLGGVDRLPSWRWRVRLVDPGTGRRISLGTYKTKAEAERAFASAVTDQQKGAWVAPENGRVTLEDYAWQWLDVRLTRRGERLRPPTRELYEGFLRLHILPTLGSVPLGRLTTADIRRWHADLLTDGPGAPSVAKCYRLLRTILTTAVEDGLIVANPCAIKGAGVEPEEERPLPALAEVYELAATVAPQFRALVLLAAFGGMRRGELLALTRRDIDLLHRTVTVRLQRQESKGGHHLVSAPKTDAGKRTLVLPASLIPEVEAHLDSFVGPEPDAPLFVGTRGAPVRVVTWQRDWTRARRALGLEGVRLRPSPRRRHHGGGDRREHQGADAPARPRQPARRAPLPARHGQARRGDRRRHRSHPRRGEGRGAVGQQRAPVPRRDRQVGGSLSTRCAPRRPRDCGEVRGPAALVPSIPKEAFR